MDDNLFQTFQLEGSSLRGRILRMGTSIHDILDRHGYPDGVSVLTGQAAVLALLLSSMLKYDGIFTLQTSGDGPVSMLVSDITRRGVVRACATYDPTRLRDGDQDLTSLMGTGHLAFTVDQGEDMERYQGIVSLTGGSLQDSVQHYFTQSEQIATGIRIAVGRDADGQWRAGGIMLQRLPEEGGINNPGEGEEDDWRRTMILLQSCKDEELLDANLTQNDLLFRLFHEEGVRVYEPTPVEEGCRCSQERAERIIATMSDEDRYDMTVDDRITVTCEFCSREYIFDETDTEGRIQAS
jgi:molecular chaperone Hsp33